MEPTSRFRIVNRWRWKGMLLSCIVAAVFAGALQSHAAPAYPLHIAGPYIVDANGHRVRLNAVNWYGAESTDYVVGGLQAASLQSIVQEIQNLGFNAVRLPWSNQMYESNPVVGNYALTANPGLQGQTALSIFDQVVGALTGAGIMVILDNHTSNAEWCCGNDGNTLWYNSSYPQSSWLHDWTGMVTRYKSNPAVIGVDLRNEPRVNATWGGGSSTDWHAAAVTGGNTVLAANPNLLIFVEGVNYALDLSGVASLPVTLNVVNRVVYEAHDYGFDYSGLSSYSNYVSNIQSRWGYLVTGSSPQPLWIGEFGTCNTASTCVSSPSSGDNGYWFGFLTTYLRQHSLDWSYWPINGTESTGSSRVYGSAETYGILDTIWNGGALTSLISALQSLINTGAGPANGTYRILNVNSGLAMEIFNQSTSDGAAVDQWSYGGGSNQQWQLTYLNNGMYELTAVNSGLALDVNGQSVAYGAKMDQYSYRGGANQQYILSLAGDGNYRIVNSNSGLAVEVPGFSTSKGTVLDQWGLNGGTNQEWMLEAP
jgi:endoglucanase